MQVSFGAAVLLKTKDPNVFHNLSSNKNTEQLKKAGLEFSHLNPNIPEKDCYDCGIITDTGELNSIENLKKLGHKNSAKKEYSKNILGLADMLRNIMVNHADIVIVSNLKDVENISMIKEKEINFDKD